MNNERREVLKIAVWSAPIIATAVAMPYAVASQVACVTQTSPGTDPGDNGTYTVGQGFITVNYKRPPDIYEINAKGKTWQKSFGTNYGTAPKRGTLNWTVEIPGCANKIQVHDFNSHYGEPSFPIKKG